VNEFHRFSLCALHFASIRLLSLPLMVCRLSTSNHQTRCLKWFELIFIVIETKKKTETSPLFFHSFVTFFKSHQLIRSFHKRRSI
jgi:hypothetical protein